MSMRLAKGTADHFFASIDWVLLGKQKADLVEIIGQRSEAVEDLAEEDWQVQSLTGILHLIDGVQDFFDAWIPGEGA